MSPDQIGQRHPTITERLTSVTPQRRAATRVDLEAQYAENEFRGMGLEIDVASGNATVAASAAAVSVSTGLLLFSKGILEGDVAEVSGGAALVAFGVKMARVAFRKLDRMNQAFEISHSHIGGQLRS